MRELKNDPFYAMIAEYDRCIIDYCLIEDDTPHHGYRSHKDAVLFAMLKVIERYIDEQLKNEIESCREVRDEPFPWNLDIGKAKAHRIDPEELLHVPKILRTDRIGQRFYDCGLPDPLEGGTDTVLVCLLGDPAYVRIRTGRVPQGKLRIVPCGNG